MTEKCVFYTRSSKDTHDVSPAAQRTELRAYAERKGYRVVGDFSDAAVSANANPPQLAAMLQELSTPKRDWTIIVAIESARVARDADLAGVIAYQARKAGWDSSTASTHRPITPRWISMRDQIMRGFDAYWSLISKQKGLAGMRTNVQLGHRAGGRAPLGYQLEHTETGAIRNGEPVKKSKLVPDPEWAPRVKHYLTLHCEGRAHEAARTSGLNRNVTTLISVERNALVYAGITVWNRHVEKKLRAGRARYRPRDEWVLQPDTHEPFITEGQAESLMEQALPRRERRTRSIAGPENSSSAALFTHRAVRPSSRRAMAITARARGGAFRR